jgi:hypothetical protein
MNKQSSFDMLTHIHVAKQQIHDANFRYIQISVYCKSTHFRTGDLSMLYVVEKIFGELRAEH